MDTRAERLGPHATLVHAGPWADLSRYEITRPDTGRTIRGKVFHKKSLGLSGMEVSFTQLPPGVALPFTHRHKQNEEIYVFVAGEGEILLDGRRAAVREGTIVRVAPPALRSLRNTGSTPLTYICVQAREGSLAAWTLEDGELGPAPEWAR